MLKQILKDPSLGLDLFIIVRMVANKDAIEPDEDNIKIYSADSKTNPHDKDTDLAKGWVYSLLMSASLVLLPTLAIGFRSKDIGGDTDDAAEDDTFPPLTKNQLLVNTLLPSLGVFILLQFLSPKISIAAASDTLQERSKGLDLKDAIMNQLMNTGVVAALLLTVVLAMVQADLPSSEPSSFISQWYMTLCAVGVYYGLVGTAMSVVCLIYIQPLEGKAAEDFISIMALYVGEPITGCVCCLLFTLDAMVLWIWGQVGEEAGIYAALLMWWATFRTLTAVSNLARWENPEIAPAVRTDRKKVVTRGAMLSGNFG